MKKLRAKQNVQIQTPQGPVFVNGPEVSVNDELLSEGQVIEVPDDFVVNEAVFEVLDGPKPAGKRQGTTAA